MLLDRINNPADLRRLPQSQLGPLCEELRAEILRAVGKAGGHLGSNLGIVELTVALHRVFDSPHDAILFDTGHQAYAHKMLTGRWKNFDSLRSTDGLSGYPARSESEHDWIENSHASTALSYAHGLAFAFQADPLSTRRVVAVIGDGSLTGGMAFEGLNNLGHSGAKAIIVLNDNGRSYAPTVSKLSESLAKLRANPTFSRQQSRIERMLGELPRVGRDVERAVDAAKAAVREMWLPTSFFEPLGVVYHGPYDGHDIEELTEAFEHALAIDGPVVVHVRTEKGRGYAPAENDPVKKMHDTGPFALTETVSVEKPATSAAASAAENKPKAVAKPEIKYGKYTKAFSEALISVGESDERVVAITAAMPDSTGVLDFAIRHPQRVIDVGIAEQHAVTAAAGMAMGGLKPIVAVYSSFMTRAFDQVMLDVGLHELDVVFCLDRAGVTGPDGPSAHGVSDLVLFSKVPKMTILAPSNYGEVAVMLKEALKIAGPVMLRWPRTPAAILPSDQVGSGLSARCVSKGDGSLAILALGKMVETAKAAAAQLASESIQATVYDIRCAKPLDQQMLLHASQHDAVLTIEDGLAAGGIGAEIRSQLSDGSKQVKVAVMGLSDRFLPHGDPEVLLSREGLDAAGVVARAKSLLQRQSR